MAACVISDLLVLQELLLLVLLILLELLEVVLLLQCHLLLCQKVGIKTLTRSPTCHDVRASGRRGHARGLVADWLPGIRGGETVKALGDVGVRPYFCRGVMQRLV